MIALITYQSRVLDSLRDFFRRSSKDGRPEEAFRAVLEKNAMPPVPYIPAAGVSIFARAGPPRSPPSRPSATAAGFFFDFASFAMPPACHEREPD